MFELVLNFGFIISWKEALYLFLRKISMNFMFGVKGFALTTQRQYSWELLTLSLIYLVLLKYQNALRTFNMQVHFHAFEINTQRWNTPVQEI